MDEPTEDELLDSIAGCLNPATRLPVWMQTPALGRDMRPITRLVVRAILDRYHVAPKVRGEQSDCLHCLP